MWRYARYVNICGAIVDDVSPEYFVETFLPHLFALAIDKVSTTHHYHHYHHQCTTTTTHSFLSSSLCGADRFCLLPLPAPRCPT